MSETVLSFPYNFTPWPFQEEIFKAFYEDGVTRFFEVWHRRGGKDKTFLTLMVEQMMERVGNYCHVFPQRNRARRIVWQGIDNDGKRYTDHFPEELVFRRSEVEMTISMRHPQDLSKEGSIYWCMGSDKDVNLLVGANPVGIIWSEFGEINPTMRERALPILRANGGWEAIVMTPRGRNHAYRLYNTVRHNTRWHTSFLDITKTTKSDGTPVTTKADVQADIDNGMSYEAAQQEYYLSWDAPMPGAYYSQEMQRIDDEGRIRDIPYDPDLPVYTAWNLGHDEVNAIWFFQLAGSEVRFIDFAVGNHCALGYEDDPTRDGWIDIVWKKPYIYDHSKVIPPLSQESYEVHYGPHDLEQHEYSTGKTRYGYALEFGRKKYKKPFRFTVVPKGRVSSDGTLDADGIQAARRLLARSVFDANKCALGIDAIRCYRREFNDATQVFMNHPLRDWAHSASDAFRYAAIGIGLVREPLKPEVPPGSFQSIGDNLDTYRRTGRWPGQSSPPRNRGRR